MKRGRDRFEFHLSALEKLLAASEKQVTPAFWLYQNNARTPLFMLEGLAKLYGGIHDKETFAKLKMHFKLLEDALGAIDYYDVLARQFKDDKTVSAKALKLVQSKVQEKTLVLDELLIEKNWLGKEKNRIGKIRKKLDEVDWLDEKPEIKAIEDFYKSSIGKINDFARQFKSGFTELETQVHELRRKLRWLSIYPQALQGCIQLTTDNTADKNLAKYLTPEVVNSPFIKMPDRAGNTCLLILVKDYYLALSWMISELGKLKDNGLRLMVLEEAKNKSAADSATTKSVLLAATSICNTFFADKNLDKLV